MIDARDRLLIFEDFRVDRGLPKYVRAKSETSYNEGSIMMVNPQTLMVSSGDFKSLARARSWWGRLWLRIRNWFRRVTPEPGVSIQEFFTKVRGEFKDLSIVEARAQGYEQAIVRAQQAGQQALYEQLVGGLKAYRLETHLLGLGLTKYIDEDDLVRFYKQSKRGLRLDWIKNFIRQIPSDVLKNKVQADEIGAFDNYVILHYDPQAKSWAETEKERAARKDPILFGVMENRRRLYFVGDWKDEYCDLTLDQIADALGEGAVKEIDSSVMLAEESPRSDG